MTSPRRFLTSLFASLGIFAVAFIVLATTYTPAADAQEATDTPEGTAAIYTIDSEQSTARYRVMEELATQGEVEAVGETHAIIGTIYLDDSFAPLAGSRVDVDLRTLTSDETNRDNHLYNDTLETGTYPLATFVITSVEGLDSGIADLETITFTLVGDLTLHGVTNETTWEVTATRSGDTITASAATVVVIEDYGMEKPYFGPVVSIDDEITLEFDFTAVPGA
jgi:polyisoprenoid-binding protein YceI